MLIPGLRAGDLGLVLGRGLGAGCWRGCWRLGCYWLELGDVADHFAFAAIKADVAGVSGGDAEGTDDEVGALQVDGVAHDGIDCLH